MVHPVVEDARHANPMETTESTQSESQRVMGAVQVHNALCAAPEDAWHCVEFHKDETSNMTYLTLTRATVPDAARAEGAKMMVSRTTVSKALARALLHGLEAAETVTLAAMGPHACNQAVKAVAIASLRTPCFFRVARRDASAAEGAPSIEVGLTVWRARAERS